MKTTSMSSNNKETMNPIERTRKWLHDKLGWGYRQRKEGLSFKPVGGDSFQPLYACRFCEHELAQDSQGNWFHLS